MPQTLLPVFPAEATPVNDLISFCKRDGAVYYLHGCLPVFTHAENDLKSFRLFTSQLVVNGTCTQAELVRAFGISPISRKRHVKKLRAGGSKAFFAARRKRQPRVLTAEAAPRASVASRTARRGWGWAAPGWWSGYAPQWGCSRKRPRASSELRETFPDASPYRYVILDRVIPPNEQHLRRLVRDYVACFQEDRIYDALGKDSPNRRPVQKKPSREAALITKPRVSGLHHRYSWSQAA